MDPRFTTELLPLLRCPETRQPLAVASGEMRERLEARCAAGQLRDRAGKLVAPPVGEGLVREDGALFFPMRDGIPILIADEAIAL